MVGLLTFGKKKFESVDDVMRKTISPLHDNLQAMLPLVDKDSDDDRKAVTTTEKQP